ncbi:MAG: hypothetical protein HPY65_02125 [Syntrophaceae bacterium]|nr:hypothetical protein [Syntrophaceae bacterium]
MASPPPPAAAEFLAIFSRGGTAGTVFSAAWKRLAAAVMPAGAILIGPLG